MQSNPGGAIAVLVLFIYFNCFIYLIHWKPLSVIFLLIGRSIKTFSRLLLFDHHEPSCTEIANNKYALAYVQYFQFFSSIILTMSQEQSNHLNAAAVVSNYFVIRHSQLLSDSWSPETQLEYCWNIIVYTSASTGGPVLVQQVSNISLVEICCANNPH